MAHGDKPYRVYRGGRARGNVPLKRKSGLSGTRGEDSKGATGPHSRRRLHLPGLGFIGGSWKRRILLGFILLVLLFFAWALAGYLSLRSGTEKANQRLGEKAEHALTPAHGLMLTTATNILVLGTDHSGNVARAADNHSDSIMIVHTDPSRHRIVYLSIPRDLRVDIPGHGYDRINSAFQIGGAALAVRTVSTYTGLSINHVIVVDFAQFRDLIDALGGVNIDVPHAVYSDAFDCPYTAQKCASWNGYRFAKGWQHMDGRHALVYSRIRVNKLDPAESNDLARSARQQQVVQAVLSKITGVGTMIKLPWLGDDLLKPMATDLTAFQLMQLGWVKLRASHTLHCRLGGDSQLIGGASEISPSEDNFQVIAMVNGTVPPRAPDTSTSAFAPGCSSATMLP